MTDQSTLSWHLLAWIAVGGFVIFRQRSTQSKAIGLARMYLINLGLIHWFGAAIYLLPWYDPLYPSEDVETGFKFATYGVVAFGAGVTIATQLLKKFSGLPRLRQSGSKFNERIALIYIAIALCCYFILLPLFGGLPTVTGLLMSGWTLMVIGLSLKLWRAWEKGNWKSFLFWIFPTMSLPLVTVISEGFLGYGTVAVISVLTFVAGFYRPRWHLVFIVVVVAYLGLSVYVTYMRDRSILRSGEENASIRYNHYLTTASEPELFNINNNDHLSRIDERLNMNSLVGAAVHRIESGAYELAYGSTLWEALLALIPRAIWRDKTVFAGSGDLVSRFTGYHFAEGTSVGIGQVMEFYINFGLPGVLVGFLVLGLTIGAIDEFAGVRLAEDKWQAFSVWFILGLAFLQAGGSLVEVTSTAGISVLTVLLINWFIPQHGSELNAEEPGRFPLSLQHRSDYIGNSDQRYE